MRVVADTNVFISALMFGGLPGRFLDLALQGKFTLLTSPPLLGELDEKLRGKFAVSDRDVLVIRAKAPGTWDRSRFIISQISESSVGHPPLW